MVSKYIRFFLCGVLGQTDLGFILHKDKAGYIYLLVSTSEGPCHSRTN